MSVFLNRILQANNGLIVQSLAAAGGVGIDDTVAILAQQVPEIARRIAMKSENDPDDFAHLLAALNDSNCDACLEDVRLLLSRRIIRDGEAALEHLYGGLEQAHRLADQLNDTNEHSIFNRQMMTFSVNLTLAMMAQRYKQYRLGLLDAAPSENALHSLTAALLTGIGQGIKRAFLRRRKSVSYGRKADLSVRKAPTGAKPGLGDLLGDLLDDTVILDK